MSRRLKMYIRMYILYMERELAWKMADEAGCLVIRGKRIGDLRVADLKKELEERGLSRSGNKKELVMKLSEALVAEQAQKKQEQEEDGGGDTDRGRKKTAGRARSSKSSSSSSGSESRSRSRSVDDKSRSGSSSSSRSGSSSDSRSRSRSASSRSSGSSASRSPPPKKPTLSKVAKPGPPVDNGGHEETASQPRSPLKMMIRKGVVLLDGSTSDQAEESPTKDQKRKDQKSEEAPEIKVPEPETTKEEKQHEKTEEEGSKMDVEEEHGEEEVMEVESPKRRVSVKNPEDRRVAVVSSKEDQETAADSPTDDRRIVQEKEADTSNDGEPNSTTNDVIEVKEVDDLGVGKREVDDQVKKEEDETEQKPRPQRKRRWGGRKVSPKRQISISSDSLKGLIPDVKPILSMEGQIEMDTLKEEPGSDHDEKDRGNGDTNEEEGDRRKIRRTVTQVVGSEDRREVLAEEDHVRVQEDMEIQEADEPKVKSPAQVVRKLSRKPLVTADEPQKARRSPSPARFPVNRVIHIRNLVRPFTLRQLKELLERTGSIVEGGFWIDKIKSHCFVMYEKEDMASATRQALHNTKWPLSNPKNLAVDFATEVQLASHQDADRPIQREVPNEGAVREKERNRRERDREPLERNQRDVPIERRQSAREWDRAKITQKSPSPRTRSRSSRSRSREHRRRKEPREKERKERKEKKVEDEEPPAKLLDDLFRKTKAIPSIYWLPLTEAQSLEAERRRRQIVVDRERRRQEMEEKMEAERKKREQDRLERRRKEQLAEREREKERTRRRNSSRSRSRERRRR